MEESEKVKSRFFTSKNLKLKTTVGLNTRPVAECRLSGIRRVYISNGEPVKRREKEIPRSSKYIV